MRAEWCESGHALYAIRLSIKPRRIVAGGKEKWKTETCFAHNKRDISIQDEEGKKKHSDERNIRRGNGHKSSLKRGNEISTAREQVPSHARRGEPILSAIVIHAKQRFRSSINGRVCKLRIRISDTNRFSAVRYIQYFSVNSLRIRGDCLLSIGQVHFCSILASQIVVISRDNVAKTSDPNRREQPNLH